MEALRFPSKLFHIDVSPPQPALTITWLDSPVTFSQERVLRHPPPPSRLCIPTLWLSCKQSSHLGSVNHICTPQWGHVAVSQIFGIVFFHFSALWSTLTVFDSTGIMFLAKWSKNLLSYLSFWPLSLHLQLFIVELRDSGWHIFKLSSKTVTLALHAWASQWPDVEPVAKTTAGILRRFTAPALLHLPELQSARHCRSSRLQLPHFSVAPHLLSPSACSNPLQSPLYVPCTLSHSSILLPPSLYLQGSHMLTALITTPSTSIRTLSTSQKSLTLFSPKCPSIFVFIHDSRRNLQCHTVDF